MAEAWQQNRQTWQTRAYATRKTAGRQRAPSPAPPRRGRGEPAPRRGERRRMRQLCVSAAILLLVVGCKLLLPEVTEQYRERVLSLLGEDTDFVAAFSSVGRIVSPDDPVRDALNDAYTAVFGSQEITDDGTETPSDRDGVENAEQPAVPENVCLTQQVLGFAYAPPVPGSATDGFGYRTHPVYGDTRFHYGVDLAAGEGEVIRSFAAGTVTVVGESSELGRYVVLAHKGDYTTLYAHCSRVTASSGQEVALGDPIAEVGDTGMATGPHLHFELHRDNEYLNPIYYVAH